MNKKGFTLIELLAVIVIIGILLSVSIVAVNSIKKKQEENNRINVISAILTGAKECVSDGICTVDSENGISVSDLLKNSYVDFDQNKYRDFVDGTVTFSDNGLKRKYIFEGYNDCGFEEQSSSEPILNLCEE